jgi:hypothetical protein
MLVNYNCIEKLDTCQLFLGENKLNIMIDSVFASTFFICWSSFFETRGKCAYSNTNYRKQRLYRQIFRGFPQSIQANGLIAP